MTRSGAFLRVLAIGWPRRSWRPDARGRIQEGIMHQRNHIRRGIEVSPHAGAA
jgi:hypothetical protein